MSTPLNVLKDVNRVYIKALNQNGVESLEQLCEMTYTGLKAVKGLGTIGIVELVRALNEMGLKLREA